MRVCLFAAAVLFTLTVPAPAAHAQSPINPVVQLLREHKPVFGLYAPANRRVRPGQPAPPADSVLSPAALARQALAYTAADYIFDGSMEGNFDAGYTNFSEFANAMVATGTPSALRGGKLTHPMFVKTPEIAPDPAKAGERIAKQLNLGVAGVVFVGVESADEVRQGLAMMRFKSRGGSRPDNIGDAAARWGLSESAYRAKADVWPLNPAGELVNFTIVESKEGLAHIREIAAVKGIGVLFPGAGTLRGVFTTTDANGQRVFDEQAWEASIQQVLAACKEFKVPCGYPAGPTDIEMRMQQGFSVFVIGWGDAGFKAVDIGRAAGKR